MCLAIIAQLLYRLCRDAPDFGGLVGFEGRLAALMALLTISDGKSKLVLSMLQQLRRLFRKGLFRPGDFCVQRSAPLLLLVLGSLTYGLLLPRLGFYWDDWPWIYTYHRSGLAGLLQIDRLHRPLAGEILWLGGLLSRESPLRWQVLNLIYRWLSALGLWWALTALWPRQPERVLSASLLFLVYPGFRQQFVAINSSRHILPLGLFFVSLGCMVYSVRGAKRRTLWAVASLLSGLVVMLSSDYYLGLELVRPAVIWLVQGGQRRSGIHRFNAAWRAYMPYLLLLGGALIWRYTVSTRVNYPVTLTEELARQPLTGSLEALQRVGSDAYSATLLAWARVFDFPTRAEIGLRHLALYTALALGGAAMAFGCLARLRSVGQMPMLWKQEIGLGAWALLVCGLPFLATGLKVGLDFPADRAMLPFAFGASLLLLGMLRFLVQSWQPRIALISLAVGLAMGSHLLTAISYQRDWQAQRELFAQLVWRIPALSPGTAILYTYTPALKEFRSTDNSLTAPLNWAYDPLGGGEEIRYRFYDLRLRNESTLGKLEAGKPIHDLYGELVFHGSTDALLAIVYEPPGCLRLLHPRYDRFDPQLPGSTSAALPLANLEMVQTAAAEPASLPGVFGAEPAHGWCYAYQQADLRRQAEDWVGVVAIGEAAFSQSNDLPREAAEYVPFIQGYAHLARWETAEALTGAALGVNPLATTMFCSIWETLQDETPDAPEKSAAAARIKAKLDCGW